MDITYGDIRLCIHIYITITVEGVSGRAGSRLRTIMPNTSERPDAPKATPVTTEPSQPSMVLDHSSARLIRINKLYMYIYIYIYVQYTCLYT